MSVTVSAVDWLLESDEPGIVAQAKRDLLDERAPAEKAGSSKAQRCAGCSPASRRTAASAPRLREMGRRPLAARRRWSSLASGGRAALSGGCGDRPRLAHRQGPSRSHPGDRRADAALRVRRATHSRSAAGSASPTTRVSACSRSRLSSARPDGGWNCDKRAATACPSTSRCRPDVGAARVLGGDGETRARAAERTAELFLEHRLFRALRTGEPIRESFVTVHSPPFWHYDFFQALVVPARMGLADDPRAADGLDLLEERRLPDGRWRAGRWWKAPGSKGSNVEVVDWGSGRTSC